MAENRRLTSAGIRRITTFNELADDDLLYGVDISDPTGYAEGTSVAVAINAITQLAGGGQGNVLKFGADTTGADDSTAAFQAAIDSDYAVYVPFGEYKLSSPLTIPKYKNLIFERGLIPEYSLDDWAAANTVGSGVRLIKTEDSDFFQISAGRVYILGYPLLDVSGLSSYTSAGVKYDMSSGFVRGWGGQIEAYFLGNQDTIINDGEGGTVIEADWETGGASNSYLTMMKWYFIAQDIRYGVYLPPLATGKGQFCNSLEVNMDVDGAKMAYYGGSGTLTTISGQFQARHIIHADELSEFQFGDDDLIPAAYIGAGSCIYNLLPYDLNDSVGNNGRYRPSIAYWNAARGTRVKGHASIIRTEHSSALPQMDEVLYAPQGYIMHRGRSLAGGYNGMVITDLVNPLAVLPLKATSYTYGAYSGTNVADFLALTDDSVTESIPTSSDITLFGFDVGLWSMQGGNSYCTATSNSTAVADGDYVEIHFEYSYRALFFVFSWDSNGGFDRIQIIRKSAGVVLENQIHETPQQEDQDPQNCIYFDLGLLSPTVCDETIIRLIAPRNADSVTIHDICPLGAYVENKTKYLTIQGDQTVYGPITMGTGGGIVDRMATTAQLTSAAHDINTSTAKRLGYRVYNTTTKTDYIAQGNADNSTWVSTADGTTTITPS